jgi:hypothetical protein
VTIDKLRREFDREKPVCELCGLPVGADYLLKDGDHTYHRVCSNATATSVYRQLQDKVAALEAEMKFLTQSLDDRMDLYAGAEARARKAEADARKYKRLCDERADDP